MKNARLRQSLPAGRATDGQVKQQRKIKNNYGVGNGVYKSRGFNQFISSSGLDT